MDSFFGPSSLIDSIKTILFRSLNDATCSLLSSVCYKNLSFYGILQVLRIKCTVSYILVTICVLEFLLYVEVLILSLMQLHIGTKFRIDYITNTRNILKKIREPRFFYPLIHYQLTIFNYHIRCEI